MKKFLFILVVFVSVSAHAQKTEPKPDTNVTLKTELAQPKIDLLKSKPNYIAQSIALLDESGQQVEVITGEMLKDMQQQGKVPTIRIGNITFVVQAPVDTRYEYPGTQE